jgi:hypothetical protein
MLRAIVETAKEERELVVFNNSALVWKLSIS